MIQCYFYSTNIHVMKNLKYGMMKCISIGFMWSDEVKNALKLYKYIQILRKN